MPDICCCLRLASWALENFFSSVNAEVHFQISCLGKCPPTLFIVMWPLSTGEQMSAEIWFCDWGVLAPLHWFDFCKECVFMCLLRFPASQHAYSHCVHLCGVSLLWVSMWLFRFPARPNEPPHSAHLCTFSPVWVIMCILNEPASLNAFIHSEQVWAFTPMWVSMCVFRCAAWPNDLLHWTQTYGLSLLWVSMCISRCAARPNVLLQA